MNKLTDALLSANLTHHERKSLYEKPIYLSKKQVRMIQNGKIIRIHRNGEHYLEIGLKGFKDPKIALKIEQLKAQIKELKAGR